MQQILHALTSGFDLVMNLPEHIIEPLTFIPEFVKEPLIESLNFVPFLFIIFVFIEILEQYFTKKRHLFVFYMKKIGPLFGSLFASVPQCGFSVIASTLYTRRILSRGTLIAVYFATSDEAIPVLMSYPEKAPLIVPIIVLKIVFAIIVGYLIDLFVNYKAKDPLETEKSSSTEISEHGCCNHTLNEATKTTDFWFHPLKHTFNIFIFILIISIILNYLLTLAGTEENLAKYCLMDSPFQPLIASLIGLIPNCAISVMLTLLFIKHTISFGSLFAGLTSAGGLGLLVLLKRNNDVKDTLIILGLTVVISSLIGILFQYNVFNINHIFDLIGLGNLIQ